MRDTRFPCGGGTDYQRRRERELSLNNLLSRSRTMYLKATDGLRPAVDVKKIC